MGTGGGRCHIDLVAVQRSFTLSIIILGLRQVVDHQAVQLCISCHNHIPLVTTALIAVSPLGRPESLPLLMLRLRPVLLGPPYMALL